MLKIALTGGIGSGKSMICRIFSSLGVPVYYSDERAKEIVSGNGQLRASIIDLLGPESYNEDGYNRAFVAAKVFAFPELLLKLNELVHPAVRGDFESWMTTQRSRAVIIEAAVFFENGREKDFDKIILVTAPAELRITRVEQRSGFSRNEILKRMEAQWPDERKIPLADYVIRNDEKTALLPQIIEIFKDLALPLDLK